MQRLVAAVMMAAAMATIGALAQDQAPPDRPAGKHPQTRPAGEPRQRGEGLKNLIDGLGLTEEQKTRVTQILETHGQDVQNFRKENGPKMQELEQAIRKAMEAKDADTVKAKRAEQAKIVEARKALHEKLLKQLADVLNAEQMNKVRDHFAKMREMPGVRARAAMSQLNMTDDQKKKAKEIMDAAQAEAKNATDPAQKEKIMKDAFEKIRKDVLTDEQRQKLEKEKGRFELFGMLKGLNLTEDQKKQIAAIREETTKKLQDAKTPQERMTIVGDAIKQVSEKVLTADQRKQLEEFRKNHPGPGQGPFGGLGEKLKLTDDQKAQIEKITKEAAESAKNATDPKDKREAFRAAMKKIHDEVLTDEQRKQLEQLRKAASGPDATSRPFRDRMHERMQEKGPAPTKD